MAVVLFKPTSSGSEYCIVNEYSYLHLLKQGWYYSVDDFPKEEKKLEVVEKEAPKNKPVLRSIGVKNDSHKK